MTLLTGQVVAARVDEIALCRDNEQAHEHHGVPVPPISGMTSRIILTREEMAAGERAHTPPPFKGQVRSAGPDRWMMWNGESWEPCSKPVTLSDFLDVVHVSREPIVYQKPVIWPWMEKRTISVELQGHIDKAIARIALGLDIPIELLRSESDED